MSLQFFTDKIGGQTLSNRSIAGRYVRLNWCFATVGSKMEVPNQLCVRASGGTWQKLREFETLDFGAPFSNLEYQLFNKPNVATSTNTVDVEFLISDVPIVSSVQTAPRRMWYPVTATIAAGQPSILTPPQTIYSANGIISRAVPRKWQLQDNSFSAATVPTMAVAENHDGANTQGLWLPWATANAVAPFYECESGENIVVVNISGVSQTVRGAVQVEWI